MRIVLHHQLGKAVMMLRHLESRAIRKFHPKKEKKEKEKEKPVVFLELLFLKLFLPSLPSPPILLFLRFVCALTSLPT